MNRAKTGDRREAAAAQSSSQKSSPESSGRAMRETVESIAVAVILAFLFRQFVAEAFVIPTGSMAPTLQGRHLDVWCDRCNYQYRTGASVENEGRGRVYATTCPLCQHTMDLKPERNPDQQSFNGDRILVSKFSYEFQEPQRWDVIVFKYPGNAKLNYIKRLVGLPNETLAIRSGDVYYRQHSGGANGPVRIARKPPHKLAAMLQLVDDTDYQAADLIKIGWPRRWQDWRSPQAPSWKRRDGQPGYETAAAAGEEAWLRYRHVLPSGADWVEIDRNRVPERLRNGEVQGQLITDYYAYNDGMTYRAAPDESARMHMPGLHWVGDLAVECDVEIKGAAGELLLDLVEGGVHYQCRIDVASGQARLQINGGGQAFEDDDGKSALRPQAATAVRGPGKHRLRFSNCDDELLLWVDNTVVAFDGPTQYKPATTPKPQWSPDDAGDLEPVGVGAQGLSVVVPRLRVYRDVYYLATSPTSPTTQHDYDSPSSSAQRIMRAFADGDSPIGEVMSLVWNATEITQVLSDPQMWGKTTLFDDRRKNVEFVLGDGQFFPMGDNSPQSKDARVWSCPDGHSTESPPPYVQRDLLTGKALVIYWPHSWWRPVPFTPNPKRMGLIR